jgi:CHAT domain-containing protein
MKHYFIKCLCLLLIFGVNSGILLGQVNQKYLEKKEAELISGKNPKLLEELQNKVSSKSSSLDALTLSKYQALIGDYYLNKSDIGLAKKYWDMSAQTVIAKFGQNSLYSASKYNNLSKYYGFLIKSDSALYFAKNAILICHVKKDSLKFIRTDKIYKQYGDALKIKHIQNNDVLKGTEIARLYLDSAIYFNKKYEYSVEFNTKLNVDIGNTYTDEIVHFQRLNQKTEAISCLKKANSYYDKAITEMQIDFWETNQLLSNIYFVKGLTYLYCFGNDSLNKALEYYQKGFVALTPNYNDTSFFSCPKSNNQFLNENSALVLLRFKIDAFYYLYRQTHNTKYLKACYEHSKTAFEIWESFFSKLKTEEIHLATEIYSAAPFISSINICSEYYQLTKNKKIGEDVFTWMELNKYSVLVKQQLDNGSISFKTNPINITKIQSKLKQNQAIIEYYYGDGFDYTIITKDKFELYKLDLNCKINSKIDSLIMFLKKHDAEKYCIQSKVIYNLIFKPVQSNLNADINELIIIPHGKLLNLPFDALISNNAKNYKNADFLIKKYQISYALSCNLLFNSTVNKPIYFSSVSYINPIFDKQLSLPFSNKLTNKIKEDFPSHSFNYTSETSSSILHIATHAYCDYDNSRNSYLLLNQNEKLYLRELKNKIPSKPLAVLSACETGNGTIEQGEGVVNFSRQFYLAGIKSTITTLWKVDDESTSEILKEFYNELQNGNNSIESLHKSKLNYLLNAKSVDDFDPYYWSGIIYTGNPVVYEKKPNSKWILFTFASLSILGSLLFAFRKKLFRN